MKRRRFVVAAVGGFLLLLTAVFGLYHYLFADLPKPEEIGERLVMPSVRITDRNGRLLYDVLDANSGRHTVLALAEMPLVLQQATIATEDKNFYENPGVDVGGIVRAFWINLRGREVLAGGSTITQQVARNLLLDAEERSERTLRRKLRESWLAWQAGRSLEKDEILALYLNQMYYGAMAYGVEAAAQTYFGKGAADLTLAESALLAGLTQAPAVYNPFTNPEAAKERQLVVLGLMEQAGYITAEQHDLAARQPLPYAATPYPVYAPHFVMMVQAEVDRLFSQEAIYGSGGITVRTTLDLAWQEHAEGIIKQQLDRLNRPPDGTAGHDAHNAALVALDPHTGQVLALVGNPDYFDEASSGAINMALAPRQPGSALKPVIYAAALDPAANSERGAAWTAATMMLDVRTVFMTDEGDAYVPVNFDRTEHGPVLLRQALGSSLNIPAVVALEAVGVENALNLAADLGIPTLGDPADYDLAVALGGGAVRLLDLTAAYGAFANGGSRITPNLILEARDAGGRLLYTAEPPDPVRVLDERVAWLISDILSDNDARLLSFGQNSVLKLDRTAAVKTGTTNDFHDNWTVGYTPGLVVGVWVGNADNRPMQNVSGISGAGPIWHTFMRTVLAGRPDEPFGQPPGMVSLEVCALSGLLPTDACPYRRREWFLAGTQPVATDSFYRPVVIDSSSGLLANETTPPERLAPLLALDLPPAAHPWARAEGLVLLDDLLQASSQVEEVAAVAPLRLVSPDPNTVYRLSPTMPAEAQKVRLEAVATAGVVELTFYLDGVALAQVEVPPYETWWQLTPGRHEVWAEGRSTAGERLTSPVVTFEVRAAGEE
jgi:penicillin-binding protein 1C